MPWLCVETIVPATLAEALSDALLEAGAVSVDVSDADAETAWERPIFDEPGQTTAPGWIHARVAALFSESAEIPAAMQSAFAAAGARAHNAFELVRVEDEDWVRRTQSQFTPQRITPDLWIVPSWHDPPEPEAINIVLDPGLAFGTGTHPTTRLCLRWLARELRRGAPATHSARSRGADGPAPAGALRHDASVIDFGCGSGILAIAALKLGASRACGIDIDPQAVAAAERNAVRNRVSATFADAAERVQAPADIVVANILAQPLIVLAPMIAQLNAAGGRVALSGILAPQADEVMEAYRPWYDFAPSADEDGWVLLSAVRR
jgi:ribosomal protein L11 methyltransferase